MNCFWLRRQGVVLVILLSGLAASGIAQQPKPESATDPVPRDAKWWAERHAAMNARVKQGNVDVIFIGDSITQGWEGPGKEVWREFYGNRNAVNLGIGGDRTQHVLWRLDHGNLDGISPKLAVLMIGTNNSGDNTPEEIADGVKAIVQKLRAKLPQTKVLVLGIFPRGPNHDDPRRQVNAKANAIIAKLADGTMVRYLDIGPKFLKEDGTLTREIMPDLLHLTPQSYRIWAEAIEPVVAEVMGTRLSVDQFAPIDARQVKVSGEIGRRIQATVENNLMVIDLDNDFLKPFQERKQNGGYVGLGKTIDAAARLAAYTGDARVIERKKHLVAEALRAQQPDGYLGLMAPEARMWSLWDVHEMSYLIYGLVTDYRLFGEKASLEAARKLADYIDKRWSAEPDRIPGGGQIALHMAVTGVEPAMLALHQATGEAKYLDFCIKLRKLPQWEARIVRGRWGQIEGHAYAHLCRCLAQARLSRLVPDGRLWLPSHEAIDFLTKQNGLVITGTCGDHECWHDTQEGTINLGETCATAYLIRFLGEWFRIEGNPRYGDMIERAIYNALFAAQSPDGRQIRYYTPFDGPRSYFKGDTYCCPCNYRRIVAELPEMIYYRSADGVAVNLYVPSSAKFELDGGVSVNLRQETEYPHAGQVVLHVEPSKAATFSIALRIPRWCTKPAVSVGGQPVSQPVVPGTLLTLRRAWQPGERIVLDLPLAWRLVKGRVNQAGRVAVMRGPLVFTLARSRHKELAGLDLRLIVLDPQSLEGPIADDSVHPGGLACRVRAWGPGQWYPFAKTDLALTLTEFPDPQGEAVYFKVPDPNAPGLVDDELVQP